MGESYAPGTVVRTTAAYQAQYDDPIVFRAGDRISIGENDTQWPAWAWCVGEDGRAGWVPELYVDRASGQALHDYDAHELTVAAGEELLVELFEGGWYLVSGAQGRRGWVPAEHLALATRLT